MKNLNLLIAVFTIFSLFSCSEDYKDQMSISKFPKESQVKTIDETSSLAYVKQENSEIASRRRHDTSCDLLFKVSICGLYAVRCAQDDPTAFVLFSEATNQIITEDGLYTFPIDGDTTGDSLVGLLYNLGEIGSLVEIAWAITLPQNGPLSPFMKVDSGVICFEDEQGYEDIVVPQCGSMTTGLTPSDLNCTGGICM